MPDTTVDRTVRAALVEWWLIVATVEAAGDWIPRCRVCHRPVWSERSIRAGVGPRCAALEAATGQQRLETNDG